MTESADAGDPDLLGIVSRRDLERETTGLRIVATIGFSFAVATVFVLFAFLGNDRGTETLLLLSAGHLLIAPIAGYASVRFGIALTTALVLAATQTVLDLVQLIIRVTQVGSGDFDSFFFILFVLFFLVIDALYLIAVWRLRATIAALNQRANALRDETADPAAEREVVRRRLLQQESNAIRLTALFGLVGAAVLLLPIAVFVSFGDPIVGLTLFHASHILIALYAISYGVRGGWYTALLLLLAAGQLVLDLLALLLRITMTDFDIAFVSLGSILALTFSLIAIAFLLIDAMYITTSLAYFSLSTSETPEEASLIVRGASALSTRLASPVPQIAAAAAVPGRASASFGAYRVHKRK